MQQQYISPELTFVGKAGEVILGSTGLGNDLLGEILIPESEFESD